MGEKGTRARRIVAATLAVVALAGGAGAFKVALEATQQGSPGTDATVEAPEQIEVLDRAAEPEAEPEPEPAPEPEAPVVTTTSDSGIVSTAPDGFLATPAFAQLDGELAALRGAGHRVGLVLLDLRTGRGLSYDADEPFYPASSIKAAYCAMIAQREGGFGGLAPMVADCLVNSSNEDFEALIELYGLPAYAAWLAEHGAPEAGARAYGRWYPDISARELAAVWQEIWRFGTSGEAGADELVGYLARTNMTPLGEGLRDGGEVWSKAGWFPDNGELVATNDAGVVFSESGPYAVAIMTDMSSNLDGLLPLVAALDEAHAAMCS